MIPLFPDVYVGKINFNVYIVSSYTDPVSNIHCAIEWDYDISETFSL